LSANFEVIPEQKVYLQVKLNVDILGGIQDDIDFCVKLAKEEKVMVLPGMKSSMCWTLFLKLRSY